MRPNQKEKMIQAALSCFANFGYEATRIRHIAERAQVSEGALYRHFSSKEAIAQEIYLTHLSAFSEKLTHITSQEVSLEQRLHQMAQHFLEAYRSNPEAFIFMLTGDVPFMEEIAKDITFPIQIIEAQIHQGQSEGLLRTGPSSLLAASFFGCLLRPILMAELGFCGTLSLRNTEEHDSFLVDSALMICLKQKEKGHHHD